MLTINCSPGIAAAATLTTGSWTNPTVALDQNAPSGFLRKFVFASEVGTAILGAGVAGGVSSMVGVGPPTTADVSSIFETGSREWKYSRVWPVAWAAWKSGATSARTTSGSSSLRGRIGGPPGGRRKGSGLQSLR